ncbi:UDP:flavonoid glycosyl transferase super family [Candidatus Termititenax aidoneus]|uniref:UDP:flavonoid glycosyl transferase super family n=1 Tax=Termititenax aidoneus TaxID=2218524 RepID=A0A388TB61_TERA1|nr:UDP:flavonoid glycosyl transferase super family [Candidatus Termititenax aidoneus]
MKKTALFAVHSTGLGHAARSIPYIKTCLKRGHRVHVISHGRALILLRNTLGDRVSHYFDIPDYRLDWAYSRHGYSIWRFLFLTLSVSIWELFKERRAFLALDKKYNYDLVFSDTRYNIYKKNAPSLLFLFMIYVPLSWRFLNFLNQLFGAAYYKIILRHHQKYLFNDYAAVQKSLTGDILHNLFILERRKCVYLGPISRFVPAQKSRQDIAQMILLSGPEPQRTVFEEIILRQVDNLPGRTVVVLGRLDAKKALAFTRKNLRVFNYLRPAQMAGYLRRAEVVVCRSGQGSLMDTYLLRKKVLLVPTKGQPEQEYLARLHHNKNGFYSVPQDKLDLRRDIEIVRSLSLPAGVPQSDTKHTVFIKEVQNLAPWF